MKLVLTLLATLCLADGYASQVDTVSVNSRVMNKTVKTVVIVPENYATLDSLPVVYLLHGYSGNYADWVTKVPEIKELADRYQFRIVCPDGGYSSWYW